MFNFLKKPKSDDDDLPPLPPIDNLASKPSFADLNLNANKGTMVKNEQASIPREGDILKPEMPYIPPTPTGDFDQIPPPIFNPPVLNLSIQPAFKSSASPNPLDADMDMQIPPPPFQPEALDPVKVKPEVSLPKSADQNLSQAIPVTSIQSVPQSQTEISSNNSPGFDKPFPKLNESPVIERLPENRSQDNYYSGQVNNLIAKIDSNRIYADVEKYKQVLDDISKLKSNVKRSKDAYIRLKELDKIREANLKKWKVSLENTQRKLSYIDKSVFGEN